MAAPTPSGRAITTTDMAIQNEPMIAWEMPARSGCEDRLPSRKSAPRSANTGRPSPSTLPTSRASTASETSRQAMSAPSKSRPLTSVSPSSASATRPWMAVSLLEPMVVSATAVLRSVGVPHAADEGVADDVQDEGEEEQGDAHEVEAREGEAGAAHLVGAAGQRGHGRGHGQARVERVRGERRGRYGAGGDENDHRFADGAGHRQDERRHQAGDGRRQDDPGGRRELAGAHAGGGLAQGVGHGAHRVLGDRGHEWDAED